METKKLYKLPAGWRYLKGATTAPRGWAWACNGKSRFAPGYEHALVWQGVRDGQEEAE